MHVQNLTPRESGLALFAGRAKRRLSHGWLIEWYLFHNVKWQFDFNLRREDDCVLHTAIPWLVSVYIHLPPIGKPDWRLGFAIHNCAIWLYTFSSADGWNSQDPWWRKGLCWHFPWEWSWYSTEVLEHAAPNVAKPVYMEIAGERRRLGLDSFEMMRRKQEFEQRYSKDYPYRYARKSGDVQTVAATVHVERMTWRWRWWWLWPFKKSRTSIDIKFSSEVGEGTGSWKGGCVGCGWDMHPNETPEAALRRMEAMRKFDR